MPIRGLRVQPFEERSHEYDRGADGNKFKLDELMGAEVTLLGRGKGVFPEGIDRLQSNLTETRTVDPDGVQVYERPG